MDPEKILLPKCQLGDEESVRQLIGKYQGIIFSLILNLSGSSRNAAYECAATVFEESLTVFLKHDKPFLLIDLIQRTVRTAEQLKANPIFEESDLVGLAPEKRQSERLMKEAVLSLNFKERTLLLLRDQVNLSYEEMSLIEKMFGELFKAKTLYRSTGIILSRIEADQGLQFELFEDPLQMIKMHRLGEAIDEINQAFGKHTIHTGSGLLLGRNQRKNRLDQNERSVLPERKTELLAGETFRQRVDIPMWQVRI